MVAGVFSICGFHLVLWYVVSLGVEAESCDSGAAQRQELVVPLVPAFVVDGEERLLAYALDDHLDHTNAPNVPSVPDVNPISDLDVAHLLAELPSPELALLLLPLDQDVGLLRLGHYLADHVVNLEAVHEDRALGRPDGLVTHEAGRLDDQVLVQALRAEAVAADGVLALVDELEAQRANQTLVVVSLFFAGLLHGRRGDLRLIVSLQVQVRLRPPRCQLLLHHQPIQRLQLLLLVYDLL